MRTKKVAARVCTRRAPSHTVQSCVSGPFGALEPNGAYSGGAPHPRWRQVNLDSISVGARGLGAKLPLDSDGATRCAAAHHALDHRRHRTATAPPPHGTLPRISGAARVAGAGLPETLRWRRTPQQPPLSYGCQNLGWSN